MRTRRICGCRPTANTPAWHRPTLPSRRVRRWIPESGHCGTSSDDAPAPTLQRSGWWRGGCCSSLRRVWSRCSAVIVCWTKPNHAFFTCQQSCAKFFSFASALAAIEARMRVRNCPCRERMCNLPTSMQSAARKHWRGLQTFDDIRMQCASTPCGTVDNAHAMSSGPRARCRDRARSRADFRAAQAGLREHCAGFHARAIAIAHSNPFAPAHLRRRRNEKPAALPPRVDCPGSSGRDLSARRLRAVRRSRRHPADR